jgi:hypothetical protein
VEVHRRGERDRAVMTGQFVLGPDNLGERGSAAAERGRHRPGEVTGITQAGERIGGERAGAVALVGAVREGRSEVAGDVDHRRCDADGGGGGWDS